MEKNEIAVFGGGCFWCTEAVFLRLKGIVSVMSGYAGGKTQNPGYYDVTSGNTGHAEVIKIVFDPSISFETLLDVFFAVHDPTTPDQQGADTGSQYRSIILYTSEVQKDRATAAIHTHQKKFSHPIVTEVVPLGEFYTAEEYHQKYFDAHPTALYCQVNIVPKIEKVERLFPELLKKSHT